MKIRNLTSAYVRSRLDYNPETGAFSWRRKPETDKQSFLWNCAYAGKRAGSFLSDGYYQLRIDGTPYLAHHVAWLYHYGEWPPSKIDHRDRNRGNNSIFNLRPATNSQNSFNRSLPSNNTTGVKGVVWDKSTKKWAAQIGLNGKHIRLGNFDEKEAAIRARRSAETQLHGEFAVGGAL